MNPNDIRLRQQRLLIRSTELRLSLHGQLQSLQRPAAWADRLKAGLVWLYHHPQWPVGGVALLLVLKPRRALAWAGRFWWLWKSVRQLRRLRDAVLPGLLGL